MNRQTQEGVPNLDYLAAKHAQAVIEATQGKKASEIDNTVTKALGVLQENGVYACFLYLLAKEKENGVVVVGEMLKLLESLDFGWKAPRKEGSAEDVDTSPDKVLEHISERVTANLERLLLAKDTLEQMLIYARYGAKARR